MQTTPSLLKKKFSAIILLFGLAAEALHAAPSGSGDFSAAIFQPPIIKDPPIIFIPPEPSISAIADVTVAEDTSTGPITFTVSDWQTPAANLFVNAFSGNITLVPRSNVSVGGSGANRTVTVVPAPNESGQAVITVRVSDGTYNTDESFLLTVTPVNDTPVFSPVDDQATTEDTPLIVPFFYGDADTPYSELTLSATSSNQELVTNEKLIFNTASSTFSSVAIIGPTPGSRLLGILPETNRFGSTVITISSSDGNSVGTVQFKVTFGAVDDRPTISPIEDQVIDEDTSTGALPFTIADVDSALDELIITGASSNPDVVSNNGIVFGGKGEKRTVTVTPLPDRSGLAVIRVTVGNGGKIFSTEDFSVLVKPTGEPPVVSKIGNQKIDEDTSTAELLVTYSDPDTLPGALTVTAATSDTGLVPLENIKIVPALDAIIGRNEGASRVVVTPAPNRFGTVKIGVLVSDGELTTTSEFTVDVIPVNDAPTIGSLKEIVIDEDTQAGPISIKIGDIDNDAGTLILTGKSSSQALVPDANIVLGGSGGDRTATITPAANQSGRAVITFTVSDGSATAGTELALVVNPVNDGPAITGLKDQTINEDSSTASQDFLISDPDNALGDLKISAESSDTALVPKSGIVLGLTGEKGNVTVTPAPNKFGKVKITVIVTDGKLTAATDFIVDVLPLNDAPTIESQKEIVIDEDTQAGPISIKIADIDNPVGTLILTAKSSDQTIVPDANIVLAGSEGDRTATITPAANKSGRAVITFTVSDGTATGETPMVLSINPVNDAPTISGLSDQTIDEDTSTGPLPFTISDLESPVGNLTVTAESSNTDLVPTTGILIGLNSENRTLTITPSANQTGAAKIKVQVSDGQLTTVSEFTVNVTQVNDAPTISPLAEVVINEDTQAGPIAIHIGDIDSSIGSLALTGRSSDQALVPDANIVVLGRGADRTATITPAANQLGRTVITFTVSDGTATADTQLSLVVNPVNDPPAISPLADQTIDEDTTTGPLAFTISDPDTAGTDLKISAESSNTDLVPTTGILIGLNVPNGSVSITPSPDKTGITTITLTVSDGTEISSVRFNVTVLQVNDAPRISAIANQVIGEYEDEVLVNFTVGDIDTPLASLVIEPVANDVLLLPANLLNISGAGETRTLSVRRLGDQNGTSDITVRVRDGQGGEAQSSFNLRILPVGEIRLSIARMRDSVKVDWHSRTTLRYHLKGRNSLDEPLQDVGGPYPGNGQVMEYIEGPDRPKFRLYRLLAEPQ